LDLDFWPENRTLVKSAAAESDFGFGLGLRALPWFIVWSRVLPFNIQEGLRDMRAAAIAIAPIVYRVLDRNRRR
jgi:hypothetical protein